MSIILIVSRIPGSNIQVLLFGIFQTPATKGGGGPLSILFYTPATGE